MPQKDLLRSGSSALSCISERKTTPRGDLPDRLADVIARNQHAVHDPGRGAKRHRIEPRAYIRELLHSLNAEGPRFAVHAEGSRLDKILPDR